MYTQNLSSTNNLDRTRRYKSQTKKIALPSTICRYTGCGFASLRDFSSVGKSRRRKIAPRLVYYYRSFSHVATHIKCSHFNRDRTHS